MSDDVGKEKRAQERIRSLLVVSCNAHERAASFLVNNAQVGRAHDGVFEGTAAWSAVLDRYYEQSKSVSRTMKMMRDVLEPRQSNETVAELAGRLERLARQLHSRREIPLICAELLGICFLQGVDKDCAPPRGQRDGNGVTPFSCMQAPRSGMGLRGAAVVTQSDICKHLADTPAVCCV
jgi:hypothetical protein